METFICQITTKPTCALALRLRTGLCVAVALLAGTLPSASSLAQEATPQRLPPEVLLELQRYVRGVPVDETAVLTHVMQPANVENASSDAEEPASIERTATLGVVATSSALNVNNFGAALHAALASNVAGYSWQLRKNGATIFTGQWNWSKLPADGGTGWNPLRHMHVASVSKLVTAIALGKLLDDHSIPYDTKISNYLPTYWIKGPNIGNIEFKHLLTHKSGFGGSSSSSSFPFMKGRVFTGVSASAIGTAYDYENMNFGLMRILIAVINGNIDKNANFSFLNDLLWDWVTISAYTAYVKNTVFIPAGVAGATLTHPGENALAYAYPPSAPGWNSGDLTTMAGGAGWHMSVDEVLDVMDAFRRDGTIMTAAKAQAMLDAGFGVDVVTTTPAGKLYNKNGAWRDGAGHAEQSVAYFLPENMELVVHVNSRIGPSNAFLRTLVTNTYLDNLQ